MPVDRLGVGRADLLDRAEAGAFFAWASARMRVEWRRAPRAVVKAFRWRWPLASRQSAKYLPLFFNIGHLLDTGLDFGAWMAGSVRWWFITMDRSCHAQLLAEAAGTPVKIDAASARATRELIGTHHAGWFQFQPLLARIVREELDLVE